jgi:hypothetical protein
MGLTKFERKRVEPLVLRLKLQLKFEKVSVPVAALSKARTVFDCSDTGIVSLNPHFSVLCCPVYIVALRGADSPSVESTKCPKTDSYVSEIKF